MDQKSAKSPRSSPFKKAFSFTEPGYMGGKRHAMKTRVQRYEANVCRANCIAVSSELEYQLSTCGSVEARWKIGKSVVRVVLFP